MKKSVREILNLQASIFIPIALGRLVKFVYRSFYFLLMTLFYGRLDVNCFISPFASIRNHSQVFLGPYAVINRNSCIWGQVKAGSHFQLNPGSCIYGNVVFGDNVMIAPNVVIAGGNHGIIKSGISMREQTGTCRGITIGNDVWVGANSVILDDVIVGEGAVIAAGSVVNTSVEPYSIVAGIPAKKIKMRT